MWTKLKYYYLRRYEFFFWEVFFKQSKKKKNILPPEVCILFYFAQWRAFAIRVFIVLYLKNTVTAESPLLRHEARPVQISSKQKAFDSRVESCRHHCHLRQQLFPQHLRSSCPSELPLPPNPSYVEMVELARRFPICCCCSCCCHCCRPAPPQIVDMQD